MRWSVLPLALLAAMTSTAEGQLGLVPFDVRVPQRPTPFAADGKLYLVYELRVTNLGRQDRALQRVEVTDGQRVLGEWAGDSLKRIAVRVGEAPGGEPRVIPAGRQTLIYVLVTTDPASAPRSLSHRFYTTHPDSLDAPARDTLRGPDIPVDSVPPPVLSAPLKAGPWLAANGPGNSSGHRRTLIPIAGQARVAQRFATDWLKVGPDGRLWQGDSTRNENWYGYREPLLAVAEGVVVDLKDGIPENVPLSPNRAVPITMETVGGNYVIIDLGGGRYAFYAHIVPGSIKVRKGDRVQPGQEIGLLGNSGNSDAPHLHFHLGDAPSPLGTEGLPFLIDSYEKLGVAGGNFLLPFSTTGPPDQRKAELPLQNHVVRFR
jgi:murein DD-endopeptidase